MTEANGGLLEIGLLVIGRFDAADLQAIEQARQLTEQQVTGWFPQFQWRLVMQRRPEWMIGARVEPSELLQQAAEQRAARQWDFVIAVTGAELIGHYRPFMLAALSRPLDAAVISTLRIDPDQAGQTLPDPQRIECIARRLAALMLHALGHLNGLDRDPRTDNLLFSPEEPEQLDEVTQLDDDQRDWLAAQLREVADQRLEELTAGRSGRFAFAVKAAWINRWEIGHAVRAARPWQFPRRLSRLTTAAVSTVAVLLMTAEAWDLGLSQSAASLTGLSVLGLLFTVGYVAERQQLLMRRGRHPSEQTVVTQLSSLLIVLVGMATTWVALFVLAALLAHGLFGSELVAQWAPAAVASAEAVGSVIYLKMAAFVASVGILIGSLGASFEEHYYFRHVVYVDEEI